MSGTIEAAALQALRETGLPVKENAPMMPYALAEGGWIVASKWTHTRGLVYSPRFITEGGSYVAGGTHRTPEGAIEEIRQILACWPEEEAPQPAVRLADGEGGEQS